MRSKITNSFASGFQIMDFVPLPNGKFAWLVPGMWIFL
jgi:hypothetical protein